MKKVLAGLTVVAFVFIASSAMATGVKVPKLLCLDYAGFGNTDQLSLKASGTIQDGATKVKTYEITGRDYYGLVHGSAYIAPETTILHATYSGMNNSGGGYAISNYELFFDLATGAGTLRYRYDNLSNQNYNTLSVTATDCTMLSLPDADEGTSSGDTNP